MTAKEMFEELGYKKIEDDVNWTIYSFEDENGTSVFELKFYKPQQDVTIWVANEMYATLDIDEIKAINKQMEELGSNNEN